MRDHTRIEKICEEVLRRIGIKKDQIIVDFGCGVGNYTIPAAKIIGDKGKIYALDENESKLMDLSQRVTSLGLNNVEIINTSGKVGFDLEDTSVDVVLLYDIFWYFSLSDPNLIKLLKEVYRVSKTNALISVYPEHIDTVKLKQKIEKSGFYLQNKFSGNVIHDDEIKRSQILNFGKEI